MNKTLDILNPSGQLIRKHTLSANCTRKYSLMSDDSITLRFSEREAMRFPVGSSVGDFFITQEQVGKWNTTTGVWDYELKFDAYYWAWKNKILRYVIPGVDSARETSFTLTATIDIHAQVIKNCLDLLGIKYDNSLFYVATDDTVSNEAKLIRYENLSILGGIQAIAEAFECEWWVSENAIHFGKCEYNGSQRIFEAGINTSSISFNQAKTESPNRLYVYGSDRNLPPNYRKTDGNDTIGGVVLRRLMLPEGTPYLQTRQDIPESEIVEKVVTLDYVYPRTDLTISEDPETYTSKGEDEEGNATIETFYRLKYGNDFPFSESYVLPDEELHIVFKSGLLNGMDFGVRFNPKGLNEKNADGSWNTLAQMIEVVANEDYGRKLPDNVLKPKKGDKFILYGWDSTKMEDLGLIADAKQELLEEGQKALEEYTKDLSSCTCTMAWDYMKPLFESNSQPKLGDVVTVIDTAHFGDGGRKSRIIGYEYKLDKPYAECTYTCGENVSVSRLKSLEQKIDGLAKSGTKVQMQNSLDFLSKRYNDRTPYKLSSDSGFEVGNFVAGSSGAMLGRDAETGQTFGELDRLFVRVRAYFESLTVIEAEALAGKQYITPGGGVKCTSVDEVKDAQGNVIAWRCYFLSEQDGEKRDTKIIAGDQATARTDNAKTGTQNKVSNHRWWRYVTGVSQDAYTDDSGNRYGYIEVSATDCESGSSTPQAGDEIVQFGNRTDATRQTAMVFSTVDADAPSIKMYQGIGSGTTNAEHYSLDDRAIITFGRDPLTNQVYFRLGNSSATQFLEYTQQGGLKVAGSISTLSTIDGKGVEDYIREIAPEFDDTILRMLIGDAQDAADNASDKADKAQADASDAVQAASDAYDLAEAAGTLASGAFSKASQAEAEYLALKYLKENLLNAVTDNTDITGGLILSTMMALGYTENGVRHILSGMNGSYNSELGGRTPAAWYGGNMVDRFDKDGLLYAIPPDNAATSMLRMDGSAYFGAGAHVFNTDGSGWLANGNISWDAAGIPTIGSNVIIKISENETLNTALSNLTTHRIGIDNLFVVVENNDERTEHDLSWAAIKANQSKIFGIKANYGFYTEEWLSARGLNPDSVQGGVGVSAEEVVGIVSDAGYATKLWVGEQGYLTSASLNGYAAQSWVSQNYQPKGSYLTASALTGYAKTTDIQSWVEAKNYLPTSTYTTFKSGYDTWKSDVDDFMSMFTKESDGNGGYRIKANFGLYTEEWLSARGMNANANSGVIGATVLSELDDVLLDTPSIGQSLVYNGSKWVNQKAGLNTTELATYLSTNNYAKKSDIPSLTGYAKTTDVQQWVEGKGYLTAVAWTDVSGKPAWIGASKPSYAWTEITGKPTWIGASKPSYNFSEIGSKPTTLSGYGITDAKIASGVITLGTDTITPLVSADIKTLTFASGTFSAKSFVADSQDVTINVPTTTAHISESTSHLYFTDARAQSALADTVTGINNAIDAKVAKAGDTMSGNLFFAQSGTTTRQVRFQVGTSDFGRIAAGATATNAGWVEIASADDGNEPVYARQYTGTFATIKRTATLLDASGNTSFPNQVTVGSLKIGSIILEEVDGNLHINKGVYSDSFVSARGQNSSAGGSGSGFGLMRTWDSADDSNSTENALGANLGWWLKNNKADASAVTLLTTRVTSLEGKNYLDALSLTTSGSGNAVTSVALSADKKTLTVTKGTTFLTAHQSLANYYTKTECDTNFQPKGNYLTAHQSLANYVTLDTAQTITGAKTFSGNLISTTGFIYGQAPTTAMPRNHSIHFGHELNNHMDFYEYGGVWNFYKSVNGTDTLVATLTENALTAPSFIKSGGTSSQFLKADGSVDSNTYLTTGSASSTYLPKSSYTASDVLSKMLTVDGSGSGLDADLLDGVHASEFARGGAVSYVGGNGQKNSRTAGWIRVAIAPKYTNYGIISISNSWYDNTPTSVTFAVNFGSSIFNSFLTQLGGCGHEAFTKVRIVYPPNNSDERYVEVFYNTASGRNMLYIKLANAHGMTLLTSFTEGSVPDGYSTKELTFTNGISAPTFLGSLSGNADTATKLQTTRTIWGQNFNGEGNVDGIFTQNVAAATWTNSAFFGCSALSANQTATILFGKAKSSGNSGWIGHRHIADGSNQNMILLGGHSRNDLMCIRYDGNVGIGTTAPAYKLHVNGTTKVTKLIIGSITLEDVGGNLHIDKGVYSDSFVSARGANSSASGSGGGLIETVYGSKDLSKTFSDSTLTDTFNAYTIKGIADRVTSLEGGSALTVNTSGSGNAITAISKSGTTITATKGSTFSLSNHTHSQYLTGITKAQVEGALTGDISSHTHSQYLTSSSASSTYATKSTVTNLTFNDIKDSTSVAVEVGTIVRRTILTRQKTNQGFISRVALGLTNPSAQFSPAIISVGTNDAGTEWVDYVFGVDGKFTVDSIAANNSVTAGSFVKSGGTSTQFLKADGSVDSSTYATTTQLTNGSVTKVGTATKGSASLPIYLNAGTPTACTASSIFSSLTTSGNAISVTVAGQNRTLTVPYATKAAQLNTSRKIWGQDFDGTKDISGQFKIGSDIIFTNGDYPWYLYVDGTDLYFEVEDDEHNLITVAEFGGDTHQLYFYNRVNSYDCFNRYGYAGAGWGNGYGAYNTAIKNNTNQTPLMVAYRDGQTPSVTGANRLFSMELLNSGLKMNYMFGGSVAFEFHKNGTLLINSNAVSNDMSTSTANPKIVFSDTGEQKVGIVYTDYDSYRKGKGLAVMDVDGNDPTVWFEVKGTMIATTGIYSDGYVSARGQNTSSDIRLKRNLTPFELKLHEIANAPSVNFNWKEGTRDVGSIAQYWQGVNPLLTPMGQDNYLTLQYGKTALLASITLANEVVEVKKDMLNHEERIEALERNNDALQRENFELKRKIEILERR